MSQSSHIEESILSRKIIPAIAVCAVFTMLAFGYAKENSNNFIFNEAGSTLGNSNVPAPFTAELGRNLADGLTVTATASQYPVKLIPLTLTQGAGKRRGDRVMYTISPGVHIIYAFKGNGVKEDIVFNNPSAAPSEFASQLEFDAMLEARFDAKGNVLIYGPNAILSNFIQTGDEKSAKLILMQSFA